MDWNNDGHLDLIIGEYGSKVGDPTGKVWYFERQEDGELKSGVKLQCDSSDITGRYTAPCVVDWNNDGLLDLIVGADEAGVRLYLNSGTPESYLFTSMQRLKREDGSTLSDFQGRQHVKVADFNHDGKKDILYSGEIGPWEAIELGITGAVFFIYENVGTDAAPILRRTKSLANDSTWFHSREGNPRFDVWDYDNDGHKDLIWADYNQTFHNTPVVDSFGNNLTSWCSNPVYISYAVVDSTVTAQSLPLKKTVYKNLGDIRVDNQRVTFTPHTPGEYQFSLYSANGRLLKRENLSASAPKSLGFFTVPSTIIIVEVIRKQDGKRLLHKVIRQ